MNDNQERIYALEQQIRLLQHKHLQFTTELEELYNKLGAVRASINYESRIIESNIGQVDIPAQLKSRAIPQSQANYAPPPRQQQKVSTALSSKKLEDFIGTNVTGKIGILITIIGIFIGAKYAIDKELISPLMRIILSYIAGGMLVVTAIKLKLNYENFSAVLIGGGLAVIYFITYISYGFYQLFPQMVAFIVMVIITATAVRISLWYNQKIIAILGLVAAYAVPFLLSDGSGRIIILFSYISIINIGLIYLSFKKDWKVLYRIAFFLTWLIYITWTVAGEPETKQFSTGFIFLAINFFTFYIAFLSYKIIKREVYNIGEVGVLLINALIFFFLGCDLINSHYTDASSLTYFTLANALVHLTVGYGIYKLNLTDRSVSQFIIGLGFLFVTIAIPIELDGSWVTLLWAIEASILCWVGIKNNRTLYLKIAATMVLVASISLLQDWVSVYTVFGNSFLYNPVIRTPFVNLYFAFSLVVSACFAFIHFSTYQKQIVTGEWLGKFYSQLMPLIFWSVLYFTCFNEIHFFWDSKINHLTSTLNQPEKYYQHILLLMYSLLFFAGLFELNKRVIKNRSVDDRLVIGGILISIIFLVNGLYNIGSLRDIYIAEAKNYNPSIWMLATRYLLFVAATIYYFSAWQAVKRINTPNAYRIFSYAFNIIMLSIICNEFIHWMDLAGYQNQYKLGLSIICALYALVLIFVGITQKKKHLRIGAIALFAGTLLKLFFYDLASLSTISKTIVLVLLGIILLIISFLYNKYKDVILGED